MMTEETRCSDVQAWDRGRDLVARINAGAVVHKAIHCLSIGSTNTLAKDLARSGEPGGLLILADEQTEGRGRLGRGFVSPAGGGLWFTLLLRPAAGESVAAATTLIAGTAVCQALRQAGVSDASIKWPNDILIGDRKTAGILAEAGFDTQQNPYLVLGIGINLDLADFPSELTGIATSVRLSTGLILDRTQLLHNILTAFATLSNMLATDGFKSVRPLYLDCSSTVGRDVVLVDPATRSGPAVFNEDETDERRVCRCIDIAEDGSLILMDRDGRTFHQNSGEISLRYSQNRKE